MNVVILEAGSPGGPIEQFAHERPGLCVVQPGETAIRAMERSLEFHRDPQPVVDYRGRALPDGAKKVFKEEASLELAMPAAQASYHEKMIRLLEWGLDQAKIVGLELPFPEAA